MPTSCAFRLFHCWVGEKEEKEKVEKNGGRGGRGRGGKGRGGGGSRGRGGGKGEIRKRGGVGEAAIDQALLRGLALWDGGPGSFLWSAGGSMPEIACTGSRESIDYV